MRIMIITDSLGLPRDNMPIEKTWVELVLAGIPTGSDARAYTFMERAQLMETVGNDRLSNIQLLKPDILLVQCGVVDCLRRVFPKKILSRIQLFPGIRALAHKLAQRHHYRLTKLYAARDTTPEAFQKSVENILGAMKVHGGRTAFIRIADAGDALKRRIYGAEGDIRRYNAMLESVQGEGAAFLDPYVGRAANDCTAAEDGHHLSELGHGLVAECVLEWLNSVMRRGGAA